MQAKQQPKLAEVLKGQMFDGFLLVRSAAQSRVPSAARPARRSKSASPGKRAPPPAS